MIKWLFKYGVVIFLFNTVLLSIIKINALGNQVFLGIMGFYGILLLINPIQIKNIILHKAFSFLLVINSLNLFYFILFHSITDIEALKYLLARGVQFSIISISIYYNYDYYKTKFLDHIIYLILFIIFVGFFFNPSLFSGRYSGIIWNPNQLSSLVVIALSAVFLQKEKFSKFEYGVIFLMLIIALATGSRGSLIGIAIVFFVRYGVSVRNTFYAILFLVFFLIVSSIQLETSINRFADQSLFSDRILQYRFALESIRNKFYTGYGLDKYAYIDLTLVPFYLKEKVIGAHNGYLAILTQYGMIFGSIILGIIFKKSYELINLFRSSIKSGRFYFFLIVYTLFISGFETLITGINEFNTILFWFALSFASYSKFKKSYGD